MAHACRCCHERATQSTAIHRNENEENFGERTDNMDQDATCHESPCTGPSVLNESEKKGLADALFRNCAYSASCQRYRNAGSRVVRVWPK